MKIFGKDGQEYNSVKEALKADDAFDKASKNTNDEQCNINVSTDNVTPSDSSKRKKELSDKISAANENVDKARESYRLAVNKSKQIKQDARKKAEEILLNAKRESDSIVRASAIELEKATESRMNAIIDFNKEFGKYREYHEYTGKEAIEHYNKTIEEFNRTFDSIFDNFFWRF